MFAKAGSDSPFQITVAQGNQLISVFANSTVTRTELQNAQLERINANLSLWDQSQVNPLAGRALAAALAASRLAAQVSASASASYSGKGTSGNAGGTTPDSQASAGLGGSSSGHGARGGHGGSLSVAA